MLITLIASLHILLALLLLTEGSTLPIASTRLLVELIPNSWARGMVYLLSGLAPFVARGLVGKYPSRHWGMAFVPQQVLVNLAALSAMISVVSGSYADGVLRSGYFIAADQLPYLLFAPFHMWAIRQEEKPDGEA